MKNDSLKSVFFFSIGCYALFFWNSIVNLNDFFMISFNNSEITKIYTFTYFIFSLISIPTTFYLDKRVHIFKTIDIFSIIMIICFNILYIVCRYIPISPLKYIIFIIVISLISLSVLVHNSLATALSSRFNGNETNLNFQGQAFAGFFCNFIMFISIFGSFSADSNKIFLIYLSIADILVVVYIFYIKKKFFIKCSRNEYKKEECSDEEEDSKLIKEEELELIKTKSQNDMNKNYSTSTLSFKKIFFKIFDLFLLEVLVLGSTLASFPVLDFKIDFYLQPHIKYSVITLIFNFGDVISRFLLGYNCFKIDKVFYATLLLIFKVSLIYINLECIYNPSVLYQNIYTKIALVFMQGFLNGYLILFFAEKMANRFDDIHNRHRAGYFTTFSILIGLTFGSILSLFWK